MSFKKWWESEARDADWYLPIIAKAAWNAGAAAEREACAKIAMDFVWYKAEKCAPDEANERIAQLIEARSNV